MKKDPRIVCTGCGEPTDSIFKPLCKKCDAQLHQNPSETEVNRLSVRMAIGDAKPEFGKHWWLGVKHTEEDPTL